MMNRPGYSDPDEHGSAPGLPRWLKVFGIVAAVLVLLIVTILLLGVGGGHGPGRHGLPAVSMVG